MKQANMKNQISEFFEMILYRRSKTEAESANKSIQNEEYERCVMCNKLTAIPISLPIEFREDYEIGLGQVCASCRVKLRKEAEKENKLSHAQIMMAVENSRIK